MIVLVSLIALLRGFHEFSTQPPHSSGPTRETNRTDTDHSLVPSPSPYAGSRLRAIIATVNILKRGRPGLKRHVKLT